VSLNYYATGQYIGVMLIFCCTYNNNRALCATQYIIITRGDSSTDATVLLPTAQVTVSSPATSKIATHQSACVMVSIGACREINTISSGSKAAPRLRAAAAPGGQYGRLRIRAPSLCSTHRMCPPPAGADHAGQVPIAHFIRRRSKIVLNAVSGSKDGVVTVAEQLKVRDECAG
jgi:hypothetical protein